MEPGKKVFIVPGRESGRKLLCELMWQLAGDDFQLKPMVNRQERPLCIQELHEGERGALLKSFSISWCRQGQEARNIPLAVRFFCCSWAAILSQEYSQTVPAVFAPLPPKILMKALPLPQGWFMKNANFPRVPQFLFKITVPDAFWNSII